MNTTKFGNVTIFINIHPSLETSFSEQDFSFLAEKLYNEINEKYKISIYNDYFSINNFRWKRGCIELEFSLMIATPLIYKAIKDYPDFRIGLVTLFDDVSYLVMKFKRHKDESGKIVKREVEILEETKYEQNSTSLELYDLDDKNITIIPTYHRCCLYKYNIPEKL